MQVRTVRVKDGKGLKTINESDFDSSVHTLWEGKSAEKPVAAKAAEAPAEVADAEPETVEEAPEVEVADEEPIRAAVQTADGAETVEEDGTVELKTEEDLGVLTIPELTERLKAAGVDAEKIEGTGSNGRVVKLDLVNAVKAAATKQE